MLQFFKTIGEDELFSAMLGVFQERLSRNPLDFAVKWQELVVRLLPLAAQTGSQDDRDHWAALQEHTPEAVYGEDYRKLASAAWRLVAQNYAYPPSSAGPASIGYRR